MVSKLFLLPTVVLAIISNFVAVASQPHTPSFLSETPISHNKVQHVLEYQPKTPLARCKAKLTGPIETTLCDYETVEGIVGDLHGALHSLVQTPFFKYLKIDLARECPFWESNGFCVLRDCAVTTVDEEDIPLRWRAESLGRLNRSPEEELRNSFPGCYYRETDYCVLDDEESKDGEYVDLTLNPERFTGYAGLAATRVWRAIYDENCFGLSEDDARGVDIDHDLLTTSLSGVSPVGLSLLMQEAHDVEKEACLEKKVYYRIISGLHASISTQLCAHHLDQKTGEWGPDLQCFIDRVASHPERLQYIYFNMVLLLRAISRAGRYLSAYDTYSGVSQEEPTSQLMKQVISIANNVGQFDEKTMFQGSEATTLKAEFKARFRNVTRIMDCVGCDKCRLWGKIQTSGIGTALKILFELEDKTLDPTVNPGLLQRSEVVTLVNTLHQFSETLLAVEGFRRIWAASERTKAAPGAKSLADLAQPTEVSRPVSNDSPAPSNASYSIASSLSGVLRACQRGTASCLQVGARATQKVFHTVRSVFGPSHPEKMEL